MPGPGLWGVESERDMYYATKRTNNATRVVGLVSVVAMNALVFLYKRVLEKPLDDVIDAVRAERKVNVPVVLTREEVMKVIPWVEGL